MVRRMTIRYEVSLDIEPDMVDAVDAYMLERHLDAMYATGCFVRITFERTGDGRRRSAYECATQADLDRYLAEHADEMRADFAAHITTGATPSRAVWSAVRTWG
jgi:hypothetical protein